jgi:FkbM family methyltransferase
MNWRAWFPSFGAGERTSMSSTPNALDGTRLSKPKSMAVLRESKLPIDLVIDVGVHYSSADLIEAFPDKHHLLFEPVDEYAKHIAYAYRNISHTFLPYAVSDTSGTANLSVVDIEGGTQITHSFVVNEKTAKTRDVKMVSLDDYFASEYAHPARENFLLKIDVDGIEEAILRGAETTLAHCSAVIVEAYPRNFLSRVEMLAKTGFVLWDVIEPWYFHERLAQFDLVFVNGKFDDNVDLMPFNRKPFSFGSWKTIAGAA